MVGARKLGRRVIDRCNITILYEPGQEDTAEFLAQNRVDVVASLPCYTAENVEAQRGRGVFDKSIEGLRWLGRLGYGDPSSGLSLDLVYNPGGAFLPPAQAELEATETIADAVERQQRQHQLQAALQEAMRFVAAHDERIRLGLDPTVTVRPAQRTVESEVRETMSTLAA